MIFPPKRTVAERMGTPHTNGGWAIVILFNISNMFRGHLVVTESVNPLHSARIAVEWNGESNILISAPLQCFCQQPTHKTPGFGIRVEFDSHVGRMLVVKDICTCICIHMYI